MSLRVGDDLLISAKLAADAAGRSAAQQIGYWAKLGRELERSGSVSVREIAEVLAGARSYDDLDPKAQAIVRAEWDARVEARRAALNLAEVFTGEGRSWVEMGPDGATVRHPASKEATAPKKIRANGDDALPRSRARSTERVQASRKRQASGMTGSKKASAAKRGRTTVAQKAVPTTAGAQKKKSIRAR
jgi:hypothetical protein